MNRFRGSSLLVIVVVLATVLSLVALSTAKISQASLNSLSTSKIALQAQQYAATKAELLKTTKYEELAAQPKTIIQNSNFYDEVLIGNEEDYPEKDDVKQRICTIKVYFQADTLPRITLKLSRLSVSADSALPSGSIIPWKGILAEMPLGFALCDGNNGTPDLRDRFIVGAGNEYALDNTGGEKEVQLTSTQIGNHYHGVGNYNMGSNNGRFFAVKAEETFKMPSHGGSINWNGSGYSGSFAAATSIVGEQTTSLAVATAAQEAHENRPPYYALYYIMKL